MSLKRLFALLLGFLSLFACLLSTACTPDTATVPFFSEDCFSLVGQGCFDDFSTTWELSKGEGGTLRLQFTAPESVAGIAYTVTPSAAPTAAPLFAVSGGDYTPHGVVAAYDGTEIPLSEGSLPAAVLAMVQLFSFSQSELGEVRREAGETVAAFSCPDGDATLCFSPVGVPLTAGGSLYGVHFSLSFDRFRREAGEHVQ